MTHCLIALGGNEGNVAEAFATAAATLDAREDVRIARVSSNFTTSAVGDSAGDPFLNAAAEVETSLSAEGLLDALQSIESQFGRTRTVRWGPRTLDLDLITFGELVVNEPRLTVPHPACWYRRFVLDPLVEIAPDVVHPVKKLSFRELRERLLLRPLPVAIAGGDFRTREAIVSQLKAETPDIAFVEWNERAIRSGDEPALVLWLGDASSESKSRARFDDLPVVSRLDVSSFDDKASAVGNVLTAATGI